MRADSILLVDRDPAVGRELLGFLVDRDYAVEWVDDDEKAFNRLDTRLFDVLVSELHLDRVDGMRLMAVARKRNPEVCVVFIAEQPDIELATEAMRQGAYDFQIKPVNLGKLEAVIQRGLGHQRLVHEQHALRRRLDERYGLGNLVGRSRQMVRVYDLVRRVAPTRATVLIQGEPGAGKGVIAQAIHNNSPRRNEPFVKVDCAGLRRPHMDSELFGHAAGALPDTAGAQVGRIELADKGTLFFDDVSELTPKLQGDLVTLLETGQFQRLGDSRMTRVDVRVIAATHRPLNVLPVLANLQALLGALAITVPALRERPEDIPLLIQHVIRETCSAVSAPEPTLSRDGLDLLMRYDWPGNVRELKNIVEDMVVMAGGRATLDIADVPEHVRQGATPAANEIRIPPGSSMAMVERIVIEETLKTCDYNKETCARTLGIGLRTLYRKLKEYGLR